MMSIEFSGSAAITSGQASPDAPGTDQANGSDASAQVNLSAISATAKRIVAANGAIDASTTLQPPSSLADGSGYDDASDRLSSWQSTQQAELMLSIAYGHEGIISLGTMSTFAARLDGFYTSLADARRSTSNVKNDLAKFRSDLNAAVTEDIQKKRREEEKKAARRDAEERLAQEQDSRASDEERMNARSSAVRLADLDVDVLRTLPVPVLESVRPEQIRELSPFQEVAVLMSLSLAFNRQLTGVHDNGQQASQEASQTGLAGPVQMNIKASQQDSGDHSDAPGLEVPRVRQDETHAPAGQAADVIDGTALRFVQSGIRKVAGSLLGNANLPAWAKELVHALPTLNAQQPEAGVSGVSDLLQGKSPQDASWISDLSDADLALLKTAPADQLDQFATADAAFRLIQRAAPEITHNIALSGPPTLLVPPVDGTGQHGLQALVNGDARNLVPIVALDEAGVQRLDANAVAGLSAQDLAQFGVRQLAAFRPDQLLALQASQLSQLQSGQASALMSAALNPVRLLSACTPQQIEALPHDWIAGVPPSDFGNLSHDQLESLSLSQLDHLNESQEEALMHAFLALPSIADAMANDEGLKALAAGLGAEGGQGASDILSDADLRFLFEGGLASRLLGLSGPEAEAAEKALALQQTGDDAGALFGAASSGKEGNLLQAAAGTIDGLGIPKALMLKGSRQYLVGSGIGASGLSSARGAVAGSQADTDILSTAPEHIGKIPPNQFYQLSSQQRLRLVKEFSADQVANLTAMQFAAFQRDELKQFDPQQLVKLRKEQTATLSGMQLYGLAQVVWQSYRQAAKEKADKQGSPIGAIRAVRAIGGTDLPMYVPRADGTGGSGAKMLNPEVAASVIPGFLRKTLFTMLDGINGVFGKSRPASEKRGGNASGIRRERDQIFPEEESN
ncbi:hypothetical protein [Noviherbaspirillum galbum]|uniref:Uncharacterized protein n=1 Tax=Noviherbaspirillum galbum TaxID=2709383 RepID=A0A6B3SZ06_9BURK|nr:hypothetical protein [Noviherbaspirillum galbum]NEX64212.1 hypothetical protein [Noviherbaspirillum galbum]